MLDVQRREIKYLVNVIEMTQLKKILCQTMTKDKHNGPGGYRVRSLYFDTMNDSDFNEKVEGYDKRQKIRLRVYDDNYASVKLEVKTKQRDFQRKYSLILSKEEATEIMQGNYSFLLTRPEPIAKAIYTKMSTCCYRPKCIVEYDREAYLVDSNDIRVTFDQNLRATEVNLDLFDDNLILYPVCKPSETTMEVKYSEFLFSYIKNTISKLDKQQISNSKYCRARKISKHGKL